MGAFDGAYMLHVGMNIENKEQLVAEVAHVLRPGAVFGIYDVMQTNSGEITFPAPWATTAELSFLAEPQRYKDALLTAGFQIIAERNRRDFALTFFANSRARTVAAAYGPPPLRTACSDGQEHT